MNDSREKRILVVDDEPEIRKLTESVLAGDGYHVRTAGSGIEALTLLAAERFDLVLLDINMPEMDGWETLRLIRSDDSRPGQTVAMFSIKGELRDKMQGLQEGALDYITKPFGIDELLERVRRIVREGRSGRGPGRSLRPVQGG